MNDTTHPEDADLDRVFAALDADPAADPAALAAKLGVREEVVRRCQASLRELSPPVSPPPHTPDASSTRVSRLPWRPRAGERVGSWELLERLGLGGMGQVWRAREVSTGRQVAIKVALEGRASTTLLTRLRREAEIAASLRHPGLVAVHASGDVDGVPYLVMELVEGCRSLDEVFLAIDLPARIALVRDAARALGHAHAHGVVHRDVKPQNLLVDAAGRLRVADFGLALAEGQTRLTRTGATPGTPTHMAPEQITGGEIGPPADVWALGVVLYQAACGELPFSLERGMVALFASICGQDPGPPSQRAQGVPPGLDAVCRRALSREVEVRYKDGEALAADLDRMLSGERLLAPPRPRRGRRATVVALTAALVLPGLSLLGLIGPRGGHPFEPDPSRPTAQPAEEVRAGGVVVLMPREGLEVRGLKALYGVRVDRKDWSVHVSPSADPAAAHRISWGFSNDMTGELPLTPGRNTIAFTCRGPDGEEHVIRRVVHCLMKAGSAPGLPVEAVPEPPSNLRPGDRPGEWIATPDGSVLQWVPPGVFEMGRDGTRPEEGPARFVRIQRGLFLAKHEVTWGQFRRFCEQVGCAPPAPMHEVSDQHPVHGVTLDDALAYCRWAELRLPTEAEWEWAARGPLEKRVESDQANALGPGDRFPASSPVGSFPGGASPFGLLDMAGNVHELVADGWRDRHDPTAVVDPLGDPGGDRDCLRGGGWDVGIERCQGYSRAACPAGGGERRACGFRVGCDG